MVSFSEHLTSLLTQEASQTFAKKHESQWKKLKNVIRTALKYCPMQERIMNFGILYGEGLEKRSHGESFLDLFQARFRPDGFYILDEPEAPLSPNQTTDLTCDAP